MNENRLVDPIVLVGADFCPVCLKNHVVEIYTEYEKPIGFTALLSCRKNVGEYINIPLKYARCRSCGARFKILWDGKNVYVSNDKHLVNDFIRQFNDFDIGDAEDAYFNASIERICRD